MLGGNEVKIQAQLKLSVANNSINRGPYVLPAKRKGSAQTSLGPKYREINLCVGGLVVVEVKKNMSYVDGSAVNISVLFRKSKHVIF
jgi:hypothetical protein